MRVVGYVGSHVLRYQQAALLRHSIISGSILKGTRALLSQVVSPSSNGGRPRPGQYASPRALKHTGVDVV
jgi:hypothetical protein